MTWLQQGKRVALSSGLWLAAACLQLSVCAAGAAGAEQPLAPGASAQQTQQLLQQAIDAAPIGGEVVLSAGFYELSAPLRVSRAVTLRAAQDALVVLSGGRRLALEWRPHQQGVLRAQLPSEIDLKSVAFDQLYVDGQRMQLARFPNYDPGQRFFGGTSADALSPDRVRGWNDPAGGVIHSLHRAQWGGNHWRVLGKKADGSLALEGGWMNNRPSGVNPTHRFVENIFEELDAPGEWFLDRQARILYFYPPDGVRLDQATIVASGIERLVEVVGQAPNKPAAGAKLVGITLAYTARTFMKTNEPLLRSDWMIHRGGAIYMENARDVTIQDCEFRALGGNGIFASGFARDVKVQRCHLTDLGASGVCFVGLPSAVRSPSFNYNQATPLEKLDRQPGPQTEDYPRDCLVEDCLIHNIGVTEKQTAGVQISMAARITVRHVSIYDTPRAGVNISEGTWGGHLIEGCDVFDTVQMTGDHGSFNSWGRDRFWRPNRAALDRITSEQPELILLDAIETTIIRNSRWRCDHGWDIDLDDGSSNYELYNNVCLQGGIKLREGFHRKVHNNIMVNSSFHPHVWFKESHDTFERNIVMTWYQPIRLQGWGDSVDYNLLPDAAALAQSHKLGIDAHSVGGDPKFVDALSGDFRVQDNSPALDVGFKNFSMQKFGVQEPSLRAKARTPKIPPLAGASATTRMAVEAFLGASVKRLQGLGERSAAGIDADRGVLVVEVPDDSPAHALGLRVGDVILSVGDKRVNTPAELRAAQLLAKLAGKYELTIHRNQSEQRLTVE